MAKINLWRLCIAEWRRRIARFFYPAADRTASFMVADEYMTMPLSREDAGCFARIRKDVPPKDVGKCLRAAADFVDECLKDDETSIRLEDIPADVLRGERNNVKSDSCKIKTPKKVLDSPPIQ